KPVKEPAPSPDPTPLPPGVLFNGGFDDGFESWHVQALDYRVSLFSSGAFSGGAAHFEVHSGDVEPETGSERAEVSGPSFNEGQDLYVRDTIRVPSSSSSTTEWQLIQQLRENDWGGSPGMAVFLEDDLEIEIGAGDGYPMYWEDTELEPNRWYDLVYRVKLSQDSGTGFVEVWLDGVQQKLLNGQTRMYGQTIQRPSNYIKTGVYRSQSSTGTTVVEHDNVIVGTSYDAVIAAG
ncbi:MAG TPA: heparin lyase I family protein, partial [Solirubrobacterales bacterium]|nr:heparin lyase I family protein [Solirubrobacterales bacterium]